MKEIVVANFKMNKTFSETKEYLKELDNLLVDSDQKVCLFLPYTSLYLSKLYKGEKFIFGAQNMHEEEFGAHTGEISAPMLADLKVKMVILGHSERRKIGENSATINKKIKTALRYNFQVVLCVGETRAQRMSNKTKFTLEKELSETLFGIYENELKNIIIAYEPVWAIGTGKIADNKTISEATKNIRGTITRLYSEKAGKEIKVVYGGSITAATAKDIFKIKNIDGALIGATSLNAVEFAKLIRN